MTRNNELLRVKFAGIIGPSPKEKKTTRAQAAYDLDFTLSRVADFLQENGVHVIGAILDLDDNVFLRDSPFEREKMNMRLLPSNQIINIFVPESCTKVGCRLDSDPFEKVVSMISNFLDQAQENEKTVLLLNRFGKKEVKGDGYSQILERAMEKNTPVLIGVSNSHSRKNGGHDFEEAWTSYITGTTGVCLPNSFNLIAQWCRNNGIITHPDQTNKPHSHVDYACAA